MRFTTFDVSGMDDSRPLFTDLMMIICDGPGSTSGGIEVTTLAILVLAVVAEVRGHSDVMCTDGGWTRAGVGGWEIGCAGGWEIGCAGGWEIGWRLAASAWHRGYATEAARAVLRLAFGELGLDVVWSLTTVTNEPSIAVMRRIGMLEHARVEHPGLPAGHPLRPHVTYRTTGRRIEAEMIKHHDAMVMP
jgi:hypothetical protein